MAEDHSYDGNYINGIINLTNTEYVEDNHSYNGLKCFMDGLILIGLSSLYYSNCLG